MANNPALWIKNERFSSKRTIYKGYFMDREVAVIKVEKDNESVSPLLNLQTVKQEVIWKDRKPTEFEILRRLSHQNIIRQFDFQHDSRFIYIPMELCDKNLEDYCRNSNYDDKKRLNILEQIGKGIEYLHNLKNPIVHGDLNLRNILIIENDGNNVTAKIADFRTSVEEESKFVHISSEDKYYLYSKPPEALQVIDVSSDTTQSGDVHEVIPVSSDAGQSGDVPEVIPVSSDAGQSGDVPEVILASSDAGQSGEAVEVTRKWDIYAYGCLIQTVLTKSSTKMHPYGDMIDNRLCIQWTRQHYLKDESETDLFLLADLAIHDATQKDSWKRPCIKTLLNHPMYWNMVDKELFITRITIDYKLAHGLKQKYTKLLDHFRRLFEKAYKGSWAKVIYLWDSPLKNKDQYTTAYKENPSNLCTLIRNTCRHFYEFKEKYKIEAPQKNTREFITFITDTFPHLIKCLFIAYRTHPYASNDDYNDYFRKSVKCSGSC